jgi:hypothetical protein
LSTFRPDSHPNKFRSLATKKLMNRQFTPRTIGARALASPEDLDVSAVTQKMAALTFSKGFIL